MIDDIKESNKSQWYSKLKWISSYDQQKKEEIVVDEINHLSSIAQGEAIADSLSAVSNEYSKLKTEDINFEQFSEDSIPQFTKEEIHCFLENVKTKKSSVIGDIPAIVIKECAQHLCVPMTNIINRSIKTGTWANIYNKKQLHQSLRSSPHCQLTSYNPLPIY